MTTIQFTVLGRPQPRGSKRAFMPKGARFPVITDDNPKSKHWMQIAAAEALNAMNESGIETLNGPVMLAVDFFFCRPKGHFGKRGLKPSAPRHHTTKPDATKLMRGLEDSLKGIAWRDDSQVVQQVARKGYAEHDHTIVTITEMESDSE